MMFALSFFFLGSLWYFARLVEKSSLEQSLQCSQVLCPALLISADPFYFSITALALCASLCVCCCILYFRDVCTDQVDFVTALLYLVHPHTIYESISGVMLSQHVCAMFALIHWIYVTTCALIIGFVLP